MDISPLVSPEIFAEVREDLKRIWLRREKDEYRLALEGFWSPHHAFIYDDEMIELDSTQHPKNRDRRIPYIDTWKEYQFYNKATVFYWTQSAVASMAGRNATVILGSIWNAWFKALGSEPRPQLDEFFAVPISVKDEYAETVPAILQAHEQIYAQVRKTVEENNRADAVGKSRWPDPRYYKLHPICEALVAVFDGYKHVVAEKHADGFRHYDDVAQKQSIILARTGHEDRLSAPISFESLKEQTLPLARSEDMGTIDVIRIPLQAGVHFVAHLLLREEAAFPRSAMAGPDISREPDHPFRKWRREAQKYADQRLEGARTQGGNIEVFALVADVKMAIRRGGFDNLDPYADFPFKDGWI